MLKRSTPIASPTGGPVELEPAQPALSPARAALQVSAGSQVPSKAALLRINARKNKFIENGGGNILTGVLNPDGGVSRLPSRAPLPTALVVRKNVNELRKAIETGNKDYLPFYHSPDRFWKEKIPLLRKWRANHVREMTSITRSYQEAKPHLKEFTKRIAFLHSDHRRLLVQMIAVYLSEESVSTSEKVDILASVLTAHSGLSAKIRSIQVIGGYGNDFNVDAERSGVIELSWLLLQKPNLSLLVNNLSEIPSARQRKPVIDFFAGYLQSTAVSCEDHVDFLFMLLCREDCHALTEAECNRLQSLVLEDDNVLLFLDRFIAQGGLEEERLLLLDLAADYFDRADVTLESKMRVMEHFIDDAVDLARGNAALSDMDREVIRRVDKLIAPNVSFMDRTMLEHIVLNHGALPESAAVARAGLANAGDTRPAGP